MNAVFSFFKQNKFAAMAVLSIVLIAMGAAAMQGCSLGDMIQHDVPADMKEFNDGEDKVSLNDAPFVIEDYVSDVNRNIRQFNEANERAHLLFDVANSMLTIGLDELGNSPIPGATMFSGLLLGFAGLMTKKPGTAKAVADEKMASFNKGQNETLIMMKEFVSEDAMRRLLSQIKGDATE